MLADHFEGVTIDQILLRLEKPDIEPGFVDPRNCLVFWGRPTERVKEMIGRVQREISSVVPGNYFSFLFFILW